VLIGAPTVKLSHWIIFIAVQSAGLLLPLFGNVHTNILPLLAGPILLLPGSLIAFFIQDSSWWGWYAVVVAINLAVWHYATKLRRRQSNSKSGLRGT